VDAILQHLRADGYKFSTMAMEIANSKPFQMRKGEGELSAR
jgi:hypothetical protein